MLIYAGQVSEMLRAIRCDRKVSDRRRAPRVGLRAKVDMVTSPERPETAQVWIRNISLSGVGLLHCRKLAVGDTIVLRFPTADRKLLSIACEVIHCQPIPNQFFRIGARFFGEPFSGSHPPKVEPVVATSAAPVIPLPAIAVPA
jgi:hypothetical protein